MDTDCKGDRICDAGRCRSPTPPQDLSEQLQNVFGVVVSPLPDVPALRVEEVRPESLADQLGVLAGDLIVAADGLAAQTDLDALQTLLQSEDVREVIVIRGTESPTLSSRVEKPATTTDEAPADEEVFPE